MKRDYKFFEEWARKNNMKPVMRIIEKSGDILVADSGEPFFGTNEQGVLGRYYRTGFAIDRGDKAWLASTNDYPAEEYDTMSRREGQEQRVNECLVYAREALIQTAKAGLYDA